MHDMSNTRKEIAARLGFAAGNGVKSSFGRAEDVYRLLETTPSSYNNAKKLDALATEAMRLADITPAGKDVSLHELAEMVGQDLEGDRSRASRPGAKAEFAIDARDELMMRTWIKNNYPKADNAAFNKMLAKMTKEYAKDPKGYTYGGGFRAVAKAAGFSRSGKKTEFTNIFGHDLAEETIALYEERLVSYRKALANADLLVKKANSLLRRDDQQSSQEVVGIARIMESAMKSPRGFSRPGTKTRMTREQTEEQKAGLKIMSAADPAVGAKIAKLIKEGKPQDQAVAIALDMKRRGEL